MGGSLFSFNHWTSVTSKSPSPETQTEFWLLINISTQCQSMLLGPHAGPVGGGVGSVLENMADARIKQRKRKKLSPLPCFCKKIYFFLKRKFFCSLFYRQSGDWCNAFTVFSFMCSHLLWTVNKTAICMCSRLPPQAQVSSEMRCKESKERCVRHVGSWEGQSRVRPAPGSLRESSSRSRFRPYFFLFPIQRGKQAPLSLTEKYFKDWGILPCIFMRECSWQLNLWPTTEKTVHFSGNKAPWAGHAGNQQRFLFLGLCLIPDMPLRASCSAYTLPFTYSLKDTLAVLFLLCLHWNASSL